MSFSVFSAYIYFAAIAYIYFAAIIVFRVNTSRKENAAMQTMLTNILLKLISADMLSSLIAKAIAKLMASAS